MKIISLEIHNIASIEGPHLLNFEEEPLQSTGIFAITGATGSGKSTILDAICLALYDKTPRLSGVFSNISVENILVKDARNLLRKGAVNGYVKVVFTGIDNQFYEAEWTVRRAYNKASGSLQSVEMRLFNLSKNEPFPENRKSLVKEEIERLVGLNFEQFTKSVILAQGEFTSFLKADDDSRATILEKLTGTEIYRDISMAVFEKQSMLKNKLSEFEKIIGQYPLLSEEELSELNNQQRQLTEQKNKSKKQQEILSKQLDWFNHLHQLHENHLSAKKAFDDIIQEFDNQRKRKDILTQLQHIQPVKQEVIQKIREEKEIENLNEVINQLTEKINQQKEIISQQKEYIQKNADEITQHKSLSEKLQPEINRARELDSSIRNGLKLYEEILADYQKIQEETTQIQHKINLKNEELKEVNEYISSIEKWQKDNQLFAQFEQHQSWINSKINDLKKEQQTLDNQQKRQYKNQQLLQQTEAASAQTKKRRETIEKELVELKKSFQTVKEQLTQYDGKKWLEERNKISEKQRQINEEKAIFQSYYNTLKSYQEITTRIEQNKNVLQNKTKELTEKKAQETIVETEVNTLKKTVKKIRYIYDKNLSELRNMLKENEPCMVCGSTEHPYVEHTLNAVPSEIEADYSAKCAEWEKLKENIISLQTAIDYQKQQNQLDTIQYNNISQELSTIENRWKNCRSFSLITDNENVEQWFENQLNHWQNVWQEIQHKEEIFTELNTEFQSINNQIQEKSAEQKNIETEQNNLVNQQNLLQQELTIINKNMIEITENIIRLKQELQELLVDENWYAKLEQDDYLFQRDFQQAIENWKKSAVKSTEYLAKKEELSAKLDTLNQKSQFETNHLTALSERLEKGKIHNEELKSERNSLLSGKSVGEIEKYISQNGEKLTQQLDESKTDLSRQEVNLATLQTQFDEAQKTRKNRQENLQKIHKHIEIWLQNQPEEHQIYPQQLFELAQYSIEFIQKEESFFRQLEENYTRTKTLFDEHQNNLNKHLKTDKPEQNEETLREEKTNIDEQYKEIELRINEIDYQLKRHQENKQQRQKLIAEQEETYHDYQKWNELNDLIGSRDGKKFRKIAQEYTLDMLLQYANQHLNNISQRYTLHRIENSLSISITDHDMAGEIRSVNSLSGGESFLVSLALALALSSLSSTRLNVESLFIDEGFGTLDSDTLAIALDALESLYHQGKKVGVISHVAEMAERIPVKIHLEKQGNGKSMIEIRI